MKWLLFPILFITLSGIRAQTTKDLIIEFSIPPVDKTIELEKLRFYITNIQLYSEDSIVFEELESVHLIDLMESQNSISVAFPETVGFNSIHFNLGVDSLTNVSGIYSGDLDPTKGMYWAWQSGYINFKLEGKHPLSQARNQSFQFHLGGYLPGQYSIQQLKFATNNSLKLNVQFDINSFFETIDFSKENTIMSPGENAVKLSEKIVTYFKLNE